MKNRTKRLKNGLSILLGSLLLLLGFVCYSAAAWYEKTYGKVGFESILYTLTAELKGADPKLFLSFLNYAVRYVPLWLFCTMVIFFSHKKKICCRLFHKVTFQLYPFRRGTALLVSLLVGLGLCWKAARIAELDQFLRNQKNSTFFEEYYVDPSTVDIQFPEKKRNLIYIFMESAETTFFSTEQGGALSHNAIPELYQLAQENTNFSHNSGVGGFFTPAGTGWTVAGMVGQSAGIPLRTPLGLDTNGYGHDGKFLPGVTGITNILHENGYHQATLYGSNASFGGRKTYYESHGVEKTYDLYTAQADGIVPMGYHNGFWGMEDIYLFEYAQQILTEMAAGEAPFALTLLTVDTHPLDGYVCSKCENTFPEQYENVYQCSSRQITEFISWIQQQPFYENTTIILTGDHLSMEEYYMERNVPEEFDRRVYNCIINGAAQTDHTKNRDFCSYDIFPTSLAALGCVIPGERLGLGTNLYSDRPTLSEEMGHEAFLEQSARFSGYYVSNFF